MKNFISRVGLTIIFIFLPAYLSASYSDCVFQIGNLQKKRDLWTRELIVQLRTAYPELQNRLSLRGLERDERNISPDEFPAYVAALEKLALDLWFLNLNPDLPMENVTSRLDNYLPKNPSQEEALRFAQMLIEVTGDKAKSAGLLLIGTAGVGKTHLSVAAAKRFLADGEKIIYLNPANFDKVPVAELKNYRVFIIDDYNSGRGLYSAPIFKQALLQVHERGGKILITSNSSLDDLLRSSFVTDPEDLPRFQDRLKGLAKVLNVTGESHRQTTSWFQ